MQEEFFLPCNFPIKKKIARNFQINKLKISKKENKNYLEFSVSLKYSECEDIKESQTVIGPMQRKENTER